MIQIYNILVHGAKLCTNKMKTLTWDKERRVFFFVTRGKETDWRNSRNKVAEGQRTFLALLYTRNNNDIWLISRGIVVMFQRLYEYMCIICTSVFLFFSLEWRTHSTKQAGAEKKRGKKVWLSCSLAKSLKWTLLNKCEAKRTQIDDFPDAAFRPLRLRFR